MVDLERLGRQAPKIPSEQKDSRFRIAVKAQLRLQATDTYNLQASKPPVFNTLRQAYSYTHTTVLALSKS